MYKTNKKAFTLVELLIVIAIIGVLATLAIVSLQNARKNTRDAKRIADIKQIQTALELFFNDNGEYPASTSVTSSINSGAKVYMEIYPDAPTPPDGDCTEENNQYVYTEAGEDNGSYVITFCLGGSVASLSSGVKEASPFGIVGVSSEEEEEEEIAFSCGDSFSYAGESYPTVEIGTQCWTAKNLNVGTRIAGASDQTNNSVLEKYCNNDLESNCDVYGGLYQWNEMMQYTTSVNQGICPSGWHVPTVTEWTTLTTYLSANSQYWCGGTSTWIAKALASSSGWTSYGTSCRVGNDQPSNNSSGFTALPAGGRSTGGLLVDLTLVSYFWSSSSGGSGSSWGRYFSQTHALVAGIEFSNVIGFSVRCIKD